MEKPVVVFPPNLLNSFPHLFQLARPSAPYSGGGDRFEMLMATMASTIQLQIHLHKSECNKWVVLVCLLLFSKEKKNDIQ